MSPKRLRTATVVSHDHILPITGYIPSSADGDLSPKTIFFDDLRNRSITDLEKLALRTELEKLGENPENLTFNAVSDDPSGHMVWPRNLIWKSLPHIGGSTFSHMMSNQREEVFDLGEARRRAGEIVDVEHYRREDDALVRSTRHVIVWENWRDTHFLRHLLAIWDKCADPVRVSFFNGERLIVEDPQYARRLQHDNEAEERFVWNYSLNFVMLCSRVIAQVSSEYRDDKHFYAGQAPRLDTSRLFLANPLALQILFQLRREYDPTPFEVRPYFKDHNLRYKKDIDASPFTSYDFEADTFEICLTGSGSYPSYQVHGQKLNGFKFRDVALPMMFHRYPLMVSWISLWRYAAFDTDNRMRITEKGLRFLELLGPGLDDPDVMLRWRDPNTGRWRRDAIPAIDRWLNRAFRSVKRHVASLPPAPIVEHPVQGWTSSPEGRQVIHGMFKRIPREKLQDETFMASVLETEKASLRVPFKDRRFGIGRNSLTVGYDDVPFIFWVGVPVGIHSLYGIAQNKVGPLVEQDWLRCESARLQILHGGLIEGEWETEDSYLFAVGRTSENPCSYFERSTDMDSTAYVGSDEWHAMKEKRPKAWAVSVRGYDPW